MELPEHVRRQVVAQGRRLHDKGMAETPSAQSVQPTEGKARQDANTPGNLTAEAKENVENVQKKPTIDAGATDGKLSQSRIDKALEQAPANRA
jgi:hypothetical protein